MIVYLCAKCIDITISILIRSLTEKNYIENITFQINVLSESRNSNIKYLGARFQTQEENLVP